MKSLMVSPRRLFLLIALLALGTAALLPAAPPAAEAQITRGVYRAVYTRDGLRLTLDILDDDLAHFEYAPDEGRPPDVLPVTPMVLSQAYGGPRRLLQNADGTLETWELRLAVDEETLCITLVELWHSGTTTFCPQFSAEGSAGLSIAAGSTQHLYGLGAQFPTDANPDRDWTGEQRQPGNPYGNAMNGFARGNVGNVQVPVLYALGAGKENYALFVDTFAPLRWDFRADPFTVSSPEPALRWFLLTGGDLPALRRDYMELTGRPPVPPRAMFGLWISEYGYENWHEAYDKITSLRANRFPLDGIVLDLQWYGGIEANLANSRIGRLDWDTAAFPAAPLVIRRLRESYGVGVMTIEQSYVALAQPTYRALADEGYLVRRCEGCAPVMMMSWWGQGGMIDWTNPTAGDFWHDLVRAPLIEDGISGHWTDLGEPENFDASGWYYGFPALDQHTHADIHNAYNLLWSASIVRGYERNGVAQRPFILSRSGTAGSQRYHVALWSGDIGSNLLSLRAHFNAQLHMSLSGMDYYGSDIGGFFRWGLEAPEREDDLYTIWYADAALTDVPMRVHTFNLDNAFETAPDRVGEIGSNLFNARLRYALIPYLYSLAHHAAATGDPLFPPPVYYFQDDENTRELGSQKMLGEALMAAMIRRYDTVSLPVYLPAGTWFNFHTGEWVESAGQWVDVPVRVGAGHFLTPPLFARDGALIPLAVVDEQTLNSAGRRRDGRVEDRLLVRAFTAGREGEFILSEDDGRTVAYRQGAVRRTTITQCASANGWEVAIGAADGDFAGAPTARAVEVWLATADWEITAVQVNGLPLPFIADAAAYEASANGWTLAPDGTLRAKNARAWVGAAKVFTFERAPEFAPTATPQ